MLLWFCEEEIDGMENARACRYRIINKTVLE
jgi:hypothetical protein